MLYIPDSFQEVLSTMRQNKLRTFLTGFSITWGVMLLVVLLSSAMGFQKAMYQNIGSAAGVKPKQISVYPGRTALPYKGFSKGRHIRISAEDAGRIWAMNRKEISGMGVSLGSWDYNLTAGMRSTSNGVLVGINTDYEKAKVLKPLYGRLISERDLATHSKVIFLTDNAAKDLFEKAENAVGKYVQWHNMNFLVIGVYSNKSGGGFSSVYIPLTTMMDLQQSHYVNEIIFICDHLSDKAGEALRHNLRDQFAALYSISPQDQNGIYVYNGMDSGKTTRNIFLGLDIFMWIMGLSTLAIGLIGVANIMQVSVSERSLEIGIRKALGAKPRKIIQMILRESILLTVIFGTIGITLGTIVITILSKIINSHDWATKKIEGMEIVLFLDPLISFQTAVAIVLLMILCGAISGYIPAKRTLKISAVDAMRK